MFVEDDLGRLFYLETFIAYINRKIENLEFYKKRRKHLW